MAETQDKITHLQQAKLKKTNFIVVYDTQMCLQDTISINTFFPVLHHFEMSKVISSQKLG